MLFCLEFIVGGYVAIKLSFFMSMMCSKVTIIGKRPRLLPREEPEISELIGKEFSRHIY